MAKEIKSIIPSIAKIVSVSPVAKVTTPV